MLPLTMTMVVVAGATGTAQGRLATSIGAAATMAQGMGRIKLGAATAPGMGRIRLGAAATAEMVGGRALGQIGGATGARTRNTTTMIPKLLPAGKQLSADLAPLTSSIVGPHASPATTPSSRRSKLQQQPGSQRTYLRRMIAICMKQKVKMRLRKNGRKKSRSIMPNTCASTAALKVRNLEG